MELSKIEVAAVQNAIKEAKDDLLELDAIQLACVGGGIAELVPV
jgi:hypothetical protein